MKNEKGNILLYQTRDGQTKIEVTLSQDTVWLTADQMAELFQRTKSTISRHVRNVLESGELEEKVVVAFFATTTRHGAMEGKGQTHNVAYYNPTVKYLKSMHSASTMIRGRKPHKSSSGRCKTKCTSLFMDIQLRKSSINVPMQRKISWD